MSKEESKMSVMKTLSKQSTERLFMRLGFIFGHTWSSTFTSPEAWEGAKDEWAMALGNFSMAAIRQTIEQIIQIGNNFPPTLPLFVRMCKENSGIPSIEKCFQDAIRRDFTHPLTQLCFDKIGNWDFSRDTDKVLRKKFATAYEEITRDHPVNILLLGEVIK